MISIPEPLSILDKHCRGVARIYGKGVLTGARRAPEKFFVATPTNYSVILRHFLYVHYVH